MDDSPLVREVLARILESDPGIRVVGTAADGREAVEKTLNLKPDLVTLDIRMPVMDGLKATEAIMAYRPTPILIVTSSIDKGGLYTTMDALRAGALEVMEKPSLIPNEGWEVMGGALVEKVKLLSQVKVITHLRGRQRPLPRRAEAKGPPPGGQVVAIGVSTGGPKVLVEILQDLPSAFPFALLIVQHIAQGFTRGLAQWLGQKAQLEVKVAEDGEPVRPGAALVAPEGSHMLVQSEGRIKLSRGLPVGGHRPSIDVLFRSVASAYGRSAIGVLLTGMGRDGAEGLKAIKEMGGVTLVQNEASCVVFGMPKAAIELGIVDYVLPPGGIAQALLKMAEEAC